MRSRSALRLLFILAGCPKPPAATVDLSLPEAVEPVREQEPAVVLEEGAASLDPTLRAIALGGLIRGGDLQRWGPRGLWDPNAWVQREAARALADRGGPEALALLERWIVRDGADPYARGALAGALHHHREPFARRYAEAARSAGAPWRAAPLALAALHLGDASARDLLIDALTRAAISPDPDFLALLPQLEPDQQLLAAVRDGARLAEPELALGYAATRLAWGDRGGGVALREALDRGTIGQRLEALERAAAVSHMALLDKARSHPDEVVQTYARLLLASRPDAPLDPLLAVGPSAPAELRAAACRAARARLERGPSRRDREKLLQRIEACLTDPHGEARLVGLDALERLDLEPDAAAALLADPLPPVRLRAAALLFGG